MEKQNFITNEKKRLDLYIKLNKLLIEWTPKSSLDDIKTMKLNLLNSIFFNLLNLQNLCKGIYINDSIKNYIDVNIVANNSRALLERVALYNYLFNNNNEEYIRFLISIFKYPSLKKEKNLLEKHLQDLEKMKKENNEKEKKNIKDKLNEIEDHKQKELSILKEYCNSNELDFDQLNIIIDQNNFKGIINSEFNGYGYASIINNCTSNKYFNNMYHFLSNKAHPTFVSITTLSSSLKNSDYIEKSYLILSDILYYVNYIFSIFEKEFNFQNEISLHLSDEEKNLIYYDLISFNGKQVVN